VINNTIKVLILDDDKTMQRVVSAFLTRYFKEKNLKITIEICESSIDCVFELHDHGNRFDIILLDYLLPTVDGVAVFTSVLYSHPNLVNRIIFVTSSPDELHADLPDSDITILTKPFEYEGFCNRVSTILSKRMPAGN